MLSIHIVKICGPGGAACPLPCRSSVSKITQIYEGTNQIQRMVMARQLLK